MRPVSITIGLTPADADGICVSQTTGAAAELSLSGGALSATTGVARLATAATILITVAADESARTFTVTGKDSLGRTRVEKLTGAAIGTTASAVSYREVSRIEIDGATSGNVSAGITGNTATILTTSTLANAAAFTLDGVWTNEATMFGIAEIGTAATVKIYSAGDDTGDTFTIYGQDETGADISEAVTGVNASTATSVKLFKKVYAIYDSGASAGAVYAGWAEDVDSIAKSQTMAGAGYLVMNGNFCGVQARHVSIYSSGDESSFTFTVAGLDRKGAYITEKITGPGAAATVKGDKNFSVVQAVYINGNAAGNITVGSADECESKPIIVDYYTSGMGVAIHRGTDADLSHNFLNTQDNMLTPGGRNEDTARWNESAGVKTADETLSSTAVVKAVRLAITSHVLGTVDLLISFPGAY